MRTVPPVATLIPFYLMMRDIGLLGTWWAVIILNTALNTAFVVWMMFSYFRAAPAEMEEAALTDGCTLFGGFVRVALPTVVPGMVASAILCIMFSWNDFLYAMFLTRADSKPISVALLTAYGTKDISWGTLGALAHFSTIPIVLMVIAAQPLFRPGPDPRRALMHGSERDGSNPVLNVSKTYSDGHIAVKDLTSTSRMASSSCWSARRDAASRRRCA